MFKLLCENGCDKRRCRGAGGEAAILTGDSGPRAGAGKWCPNTAAIKAAAAAIIKQISNICDSGILCESTQI